MIRIFLNITVILVTFLACYLEDIYLLFWPPQAKKPLFITVRAHQAFTYDQEKALSVKRKNAHSNYVPVFTYIPESIEESKKKLKSVINEVSLYKAVKGRGAQKLENYLKEELSIQVSRQDVIRLMKYRDLKNLLEGILTIQESILQSKISENAKHLSAKKTIELLTPGSNDTVVYSANNIITLEKARFSMQEKIRQLFWQVDNRVLDPVVQISKATLLPNLRYDPIENARKLEKIDRQFPSKIIAYAPGDVLVSFKKVLGEEDMSLLTSYQKRMDDQIYRDAPLILFTILFMVVFYNLFISNIITSRSKRESPCHLLLSLLIITIILLKGCLVFTPFPIYFLPFSLLPLLVISLNHGRITAMGTTLVAALLVSLFSGRTFEIVLYFVFGGLTAVLISSRIRKRLLILIPSLLVGLINVASVMAFTVDWQTAILPADTLQKSGLHSLKKLFDVSMVEPISWAFAGGLLAGPLALVLLPLLEISWQTASTFKLNRYTDLQRPLMKKLLKEARGTYQHSMTVAYLAQSAGEAIGANTLLLRIGAYYHDIGKITNPGYFIENQFNGKNPHDILEPKESANLIVDHVRNGLKIGQESGLPKVVVDLILQHHGTHLIEYFYNIAVKSYLKNLIREDDYRYPGPKPQRVEAAILMIADAVEAASRSLQEPTRKKFEKMVRLILVKRIVDGQFSECDLTTSDLEKIIRALVDTLEASFHSRIRYPSQEKVTPNKKISWRIDGVNEKDKEDRSFRL
jgi:putative nucleotidyltransferase with HDIG domain